MQQDNANINTSFFFTHREIMQHDENTKHLTPYECYCLFTEHAWKNLQQQASDAGVDLSFDNDVDTIVGMTDALYEQSLYPSMTPPRLTRQLDASVKAYAKSQGITPDKALSAFITLGIKQTVDNQYGLDAIVSACAMEESDLQHIIEQLSNIKKDNLQEDIDASCDTQ